MDTELPCCCICKGNAKSSNLYSNDLKEQSLSFKSNPIFGSASRHNFKVSSGCAREIRLSKLVILYFIFLNVKQ